MLPNAYFGTRVGTLVVAGKLQSFSGQFLSEASAVCRSKEENYAYTSVVSGLPGPDSPIQLSQVRLERIEPADAAGSTVSQEGGLLQHAKPVAPQP